MKYKFSLSPATVRARLKIVHCSKEEMSKVTGLSIHQIKRYIEFGKATDKVARQITRFFVSDYYKKLEEAYENGFVCTPPHSCFTCPYPDCRNNNNTAKEEAVYSRAAWAKDWVGATQTYQPHSHSYPYAVRGR